MRHRDPELDVIRGIAIATMVFANSIPYIAPSPHPFFYRLLGSFAAPIFIFLTGYMIGLGQQLNPENKTAKLIYRGSLIIITGILIDILIWKIYPFTTFDVLYVIGFGVIIIGLLKKTSKEVFLTGSLLIFFIAFFFQAFLIYRTEINEVKINSPGLPFFDLQAFFIDGWFPVFPWLGYILLGFWQSQSTMLKLNTRVNRIASFIVFILGIFVMFFQNKITRQGYSELFYPADFVYLATSLSFLSLIWSIKEIFKNRIWLPLQLLGKCSIFIYILHTIIIQSLFVNRGVYFRNEFLTYLFFLFGLIIMAWLLNHLKKRLLWQKLPYILRYLFGS